MTRTIGGRLDYSLLHDHARLVHRPTDQDGLRAAALELAACGLTPHDIGQALQLSAAAVTALLREAPDA